jgi:4-amino-4-deoxy-L-arabinose transferase-like glycosyltransferase
MKSYYVSQRDSGLAYCFLLAVPFSLPNYEKRGDMKMLAGFKWYTYVMIAVLALALILRLEYVLTVKHPPIKYDQLNYTNTAIQLLDEGVYAYRDTKPNSLVTPGFPILLAMFYWIFGHSSLEPTLQIYRVFQCLLALVAIWFIYKIGARLFHPTTGILAALFAAVHPMFIWSTSLILTEVPFLSVFMALLYMQVLIMQENRLRDHVVMGLLLGIAVLIRPNVLPIAIVPYLFLWFAHRKTYFPYILAGIGAFALIMLPWWVRNFLTFHQFIPIAKGEAGNPFLGGTDPYMRGTIDWGKIDANNQFGEGIKRIKQGMKDDPLLWISWFTIGKWRYFFFRHWVGPYPLHVVKWYYSLLDTLHYAIIYIGWVALPALSLLRYRAAIYLFVCLAVTYWIHALFIPEPRYIYALLPFLMLGTAQLIVWALQIVVARAQVIRKAVSPD